MKFYELHFNPFLNASKRVNTRTDLSLRFISFTGSWLTWGASERTTAPKIWQWFWTRSSEASLPWMWRRLGWYQLMTMQQTLSGVSNLLKPSKDRWNAALTHYSWSSMTASQTSDMWTRSSGNAKPSRLLLIEAASSPTRWRPCVTKSITILPKPLGGPTGLLSPQEVSGGTLPTCAWSPS